MEIWPDEEEGTTAPERSATGLGDAERRDLLGMAVRHLPLAPEPDWSDPQYVAALRARNLMMITDCAESLWDRVAGGARQLEQVDWHDVPEHVISDRNVVWMVDVCKEAGILKAAQPMAMPVLARAEAAAAGSEDAPQLRDLSVSLDRVAGILEARGDLSGALALYERSLELDERLVRLEETPDRLDSLSVSLDKVAGILEARGDLNGALALYEGSLGLRRDLANRSGGSLDSLRRLIVGLFKVGDILRALGDSGRAIERFEEGLEIATRYTQLTQCVGDHEPIVRLTLRLARCNLESGRREAAKAAIEFAVQAVIDIERQFPEHVRYLESCADWWDVRAAVAAAEGNPVEEASHAAHAAMLRARIVALKGAQI